MDDIVFYGTRKKLRCNMSNILVVSKVDQLAEYEKLAAENGVAFEMNDFFDPDVLDDEGRQQDIIERYKQAGIPEGSTMHGAFLDVTVFSQDKRIREISRLRMRQSMAIADKLSLTGVVFHSNANPFLKDSDYETSVVEETVACLEELLQMFPRQNIYLENMFDEKPEIIVAISKRLAGYSNYGVCFDYAHANVFGDDLSEWVVAVAPYTKHIHINDNDLKQDLHLALGDGQIVWEKFQSYYEQYFKGCSILIETSEIALQKRSLDYIRQHFPSLSHKLL